MHLDLWDADRMFVHVAKIAKVDMPDLFMPENTRSLRGNGWRVAYSAYGAGSDRDEREGMCFLVGIYCSVYDGIAILVTMDYDTTLLIGVM